MHNDSVYRYDPNRDSTRTERPSQQPPSPSDGAREREDVPRFRKLMEKRDGRTSDDQSNLAAASKQAKPAADGKREAVGGKQEGAEGKSSEGGKGLREAAQKQQGGIDSGLFAAVARQQGGRGGSGQQDGGDGGDGDRWGPASHTGDQRVMDVPLGMQLQQQNQVVLQQATQAPSMAAATIAPALAELIERHVKQLLVPVSETQSAAQSREIMLTLKGGVLPHTELWLSRTDTGWRLRADAHSAASYRQMVDNAPQLIERFGQARLGELEVDPTLVG